MKHKTATLEGALLDAAVALAEGWSAPEVAAMVLDPEGADRYIAASTQWALAGPIIDREKIAILQNRSTSAAFYLRRYEVGQRDTCFFADGQPDLITYINIDDVRIWIGETPLIAAMRAYVASKFGNEVDLPR